MFYSLTNFNINHQCYNKKVAFNGCNSLSLAASSALQKCAVATLGWSHWARLPASHQNQMFSQC